LSAEFGRVLGIFSRAAPGADRDAAWRARENRVRVSGSASGHAPIAAVVVAVAVHVSDLLVKLLRSVGSERDPSCAFPLLEFGGETIDSLNEWREIRARRQTLDARRRAVATWLSRAASPDGLFDG